MIDIAEGLVSLKEANIIHIDIKPDNIFITDRGSFMISDLNLSRTKKDYLEGVRNGRKFRNNEFFTASEIWALAGNDLATEAPIGYPFARDMMAAGLSMLTYIAKLSLALMLGDS